MLQIMILYFSFYYHQLEKQLKLCLLYPSQARYSIAFGHICSHFNSSIHDLCPEERDFIKEKVCVQTVQI